MNLIFTLVAKIFPYILIGYILSRLNIKKISVFIKIFVNFAVYFLIPMFVFFAMWSAPVKGNVAEIKNIFIIAIIVMMSGALFAVLFSKIFKENFKNTALPIIIMNSAYLAIPLNTVFFGVEGTLYTLIYNISCSVITYTLGLWIICGSAKEIFKLPPLYAMVFGIALNLAGISVPLALQDVPKIMNSVTLPIMLCLVGYQIKPVSFGNIGKVFSGVGFRMGGGLVVAMLFCSLLDITGITRKVCIITSSMPTAVTAYILTEKYDGNTEFISSMIALGLLASMFFIPFVLWLI